MQAAAVWQHIDCRTCANCCRTLHPVFSRSEVQRIATYLGTTLADLHARYLTADTERSKYITRKPPCPFLGGNLCTIYAVRPAVYTAYPHLARNFRSRLRQAIDNAAVCPFVYNVLERLKARLGFRGPNGAETSPVSKALRPRGTVKEALDIPRNCARTARFHSGRRQSPRQSAALSPLTTAA